MNQGRKKNLLLLMNDLPFPVRKNGISIRYYPIIRFLSDFYHIHLIVISDFPIAEEDRLEAEKLCSRVSIWYRKPIKVSLPKKVAMFAFCMLPGTPSWSAYRYDEREIRRFVKKELANAHYDVAMCAALQYFEVVEELARYKRLILDQIDSPYSHALRLGTDSLLSRYQAWKVKKRERRAVSIADHTFYISPADLSIGSGRPVSDSKVSLIPNGIHISDMSDDTVRFGNLCVGYLGHMAYPPNIRAAKRLATIFNSVRKFEPDAKLIIIGRDPVEDVRDLEKYPGVIVTGTVDNIWSYLNGIDVFVFPMEIGSGQQNKVLEAMYSKKPVITSSIGNSGICAEAGREIVVSETDSEFVNQILRLLGDSEERESLGVKGYEFVKGRYSWTAILNDFQSKLSS